MNTEYEVRILNVDTEEIINKLEQLDAEFKGDYFQRRYVYDFIPKVNGKFIRLRTNGNKTTLTIKKIISTEIDGTKELEIEVNDFEKTNLILQELGFKPKGYQENRRRCYLLNDVEIDIDSWPLIPTYLEIEGKNEDEVYDTLRKLGLKDSDITTKDVETIFLDYGINLNTIHDLKLEEDRK